MDYYYDGGANSNYFICCPVASNRITEVKNLHLLLSTVQWVYTVGCYKVLQTVLSFKPWICFVKTTLWSSVKLTTESIAAPVKLAQHWTDFVPAIWSQCINLVIGNDNALWVTLKNCWKKESVISLLMSIMRCDERIRRTLTRMQKDLERVHVQWQQKARLKLADVGENRHNCTKSHSNITTHFRGCLHSFPSQPGSD